jgi:serine/threonine-protein kinase
MQLLLSSPGQRITAPQSDLGGNSERPSRTAFVFTPDGKSLVFSGERDGRQQLFLRALSGETATPIPGTEGAESPFLSPNGASLGFWANGRLRRLALSGGSPIDIATVPRIAGASWSDNDRVVVGAEEVGLIVFSVTGAAPPDTIVKGAASLPQFLPGGETILFTQLRNYDLGGRRIESISLKTRARTVVIDDAEDARVVSTGYLVFARDAKMLAVPFDARRLRVTAAPIVVLDDVMQAQNGGNTGVLTGAMQVAISPVGQLAWLGGGITPDRVGGIVWVDRQGHTKPIAGSGAFFMVRLSPDQTRAAVFAFGRTARVAVVDLARGTTQSIKAAGSPWILWSPDGQRIVHGGGVQDSAALVWTLADGSKPAEPIVKGTQIPQQPAFWSADGAELFALREDNQLVGVNVKSGALRVVAGLPAGIMWPTLSPDGNWIAYSARETSAATFDVFVQPWPALDRRWKISTAGGTEAAWTRGGHELLYHEPVSRAGDTVRVMSVDIGLGPTFSSGVPHALFMGLGGTNPLRSWDVTADGSRFLAVNGTMVKAPPGDVHVIVNWFGDLRRLFASAGGRS